MFTLEEVTKAQRGIRGITILSLTLSLVGGWVVITMPLLLGPGKETRYPLYRRLGGTQGWSGRVWKISPPLGFDPQTFQAIMSF